MLDVIVLGAGPAGSTTAALLTRLGYKVEVWERERFPRHRIGESLPPRAVALLKHLGFDVQGFAIMEGHTSIWGKPEPHRAVFQEGYGLQVERDRFDASLLEQAGVRVHFRGITGESIDDARSRARFIVVATGAPTTRATRHLRQSAIFGYWKNTQHPEGSQANDTIIESFPDGWVWSLRLASDLRNVTVVFDKPGLSYLDAIQQAPFVRRMLDNADLVSKSTGCDASWQCTQRFAEPGLIYAGDAGSVIDPLSSQGVYKAMCSAMSAAVVINTCLKKPELESAALDFFNEEERRTYDGYSAGSVATFRQEQRWPENPFWKKRHALSTWDIQPRTFDVHTATAIETRTAVDMRLGNAPGTSIEKRPTMSGAFVELADYVVSASFQYGYRGPHAARILDIHRTLTRHPKTLGQLLAEKKDAALMAYMYREGLLTHLVS